MLTAHNISKSYGDNRVLMDVEFSAGPGEIVAIIGPSGSGKSTLLRALSLLAPPDKGEIRWDDDIYTFPSNGEPPAPPWPKLSLVFQQLFLWPHLTVRQNIALPLRDIGAAAREALITELLKQYVIDDLADRYPNQLSVGQRQRVAIARAVALKPTYLLLDEITSALDVEHIETVLAHLKELADHGTAVVLVTHLIGFARRAASQVLFMKAGRIVEGGGAHRLVAPKTDQLASFLSLVEATGTYAADDGIGNTDASMSFVADSVLEKLRKGDVPGDAEARYLDRLPLVQSLRERVEAQRDTKWLLGLLRTSSPYAAGLASSLLKPLHKNAEIMTAYEKLWPDAAPYLKNRLLWRLMDDPEVAERRHADLLEFIFQEWPVFRDFNLSFYGDAPEATKNIIDRLIGEKEPLHKKWMHLCSVPEIVDDSLMAKDLLALGLHLDFPHIQTTAQALLDRFWPRADSRGPGRADRPMVAMSAHFCADAVLETLRSQQVPTEDISDGLNRAPFVDSLRERVKETDLDQWVLAGVSSGQIEYAGLCLSLLRKQLKEERKNICEERPVFDFLLQCWEGGAPSLKAHLLWRILDDPKLSREWHASLFAFILEFPSEFHSASFKSLGTPETIVEKARERYMDPEFPESKKWAYLCRVAGVATRPAEAKQFLRAALDDNDDFRRHVARTLLDRHYPDSK